MKFVNVLRVGAVLAGVAVALPAFAERSKDSLAPIVRCVSEGAFKVLQEERLPEGVTTRRVETAVGGRAVSLADGYRVTLATAQGLPFLNLKIELSEADSAATDREIVESQMKAFSDRRAPGQKEMQKSSKRGVEMMALHQPSLERGDMLSLYTYFVPAKSIIATLYVRNQEASKRAFATFAEYEKLRDQADTLIQGCLAR